MKLFLRFVFLFLFFRCEAQMNAGMPLVREMATRFFYQYTAFGNHAYYHFEKKPEGWFVRMLNVTDGTYSPSKLFWDKKGQRYLPLDFLPQHHPDSMTVAEAMADYAEKYILSEFEIMEFDRNLYYGYDGWIWDVITHLEASPPTSDSLWECLGRAYDGYAGGFISYAGDIPFQNNDPDRRVLADPLHFPLSRAKKYMYYENKSIAAFTKVYEMNHQYRCAYYDIRCQINTEAMTTFNILRVLGLDSLGRPFLQKVSFPDTVLQKARQSLGLVEPNSILFTDGDTATLPIAYLQAGNERGDIILLDNLMFFVKQDIAYLDRKYHGSLFMARSNVYLDPAFSMARFQTDDKNAGEHRLDSFLVALYASPDARGLPQVDSSLGRLYRYFSQRPYMVIDSGKARAFYPDRQLAGRISWSLPNNYLLFTDLLNLDIIQSNLLSRHIYFTSPSAHPMFAPYCIKLSDNLWEFIPMKNAVAVSSNPKNGSNLDHVWTNGNMTR